MDWRSIGALGLLVVTACSQQATKDEPAESPIDPAPAAAGAPTADPSSEPSEGDDGAAEPIEAANLPPGSQPIVPDPPVVEMPVPAPMTENGPRCDKSKPFGPARPATGVNATISTAHARVSADELSVFFTKVGGTTNDVFFASRADLKAPWSEPALLTTVSSTTFQDGSATVTGDGLRMFFHSNRTPTSGDYDLWTARRAKATDAWGAPARVTALASTTRDVDPYVRNDGRMLVFASNRVVGTVAANYDLYRAYIDETGAVGAPSRIAELTTTASETNPVLTPDGLSLYFARKGVSQDIWVARRPAVDKPFAAPTRIEELTTTADERPTWVSADECVIWLSSVVTGAVSEHYIAERGK